MGLYNFIQQVGGSMKGNVSVIGIDLAKDVFQLHGADSQGNIVFSKRVSRHKLTETMAKLPPCLVGIEACGGSHYWARVFSEQGHTVKMMSPQFVKPYVKSNKNDARDADAISEAVTRPTMRFVPIKNQHQQDILMLHRVREQIQKNRTALGNQIRGMLMEYGVVIPKGVKYLNKLPEYLEANADKLSEFALRIFEQLYETLKRFNEQLEQYNKDIKQHAATDPRCIAIKAIEGVGDISASAIVAMISDAGVFKNGREVSAWLGLVPKQFSSGNRVVLGRISKRGDRYMRKLLIHGARSVVKNCENKSDDRSVWVKNTKGRCGYNKSVVAVANKNARIIWAILATGECYRKPQAQA